MFAVFLLLYFQFTKFIKFPLINTVFLTDVLSVKRLACVKRHTRVCVIHTIIYPQHVYSVIPLAEDKQSVLTGPGVISPR